MTGTFHPRKQPKPGSNQWWREFWWNLAVNGDRRAMKEYKRLRGHRGRPRPLAARRHIWPKHCGCGQPHGWMIADLSIFTPHTSWTVAPR